MGFPQMKQSLARVSKLNRDPVLVMFEELREGLSGMIVDAFQRRFDPQRGGAALEAQGGRLARDPDTLGANVPSADQSAGMATVGA